MSRATIELGVLDQSPVRSGGSFSDAIGETIALAQATEKFGYSRYWLAEHHAAEGFAGSAPEIMVGRVAAATERIRVGSGGVMLAHYSPLKVAETFRLLEVLYPGRIDLGIGRTAVALAYGNRVGIEYFPTKVADLMAFLGGRNPVTEVLAGVQATPKPDGAPDLWLLGSSSESARLAAQMGIAFSFAHFINPFVGGEVTQTYRGEFVANDASHEPRASVGVFVICADSEEEAWRLAKSRDLWRLRADQGQLSPFPSVEEAEAYDYAPSELERIEYNRQRYVVGDPVQVVQQLTALVEQHEADELVLLTITHDHEARKRSYELVAEAFGAG